ncbi:spore coat protein YutH [Bacillus sp. OV322]|nr:spore coat protein YutH [Bacillus sp. OV322]
MIEDVIYSNYNITVEKEEAGSRFPSFYSGNVIYSIIPLEELEPEELEERQKMSEHLLQQGDRYVSGFVASNHGSYISDADGAMFVLLANPVLDEPRSYRLGRKLAKFHHRARTISYPIKKCSRIGNWRQLWEQRIDQLERMWNEKLMAHPHTKFEQLFIETFPYYMSLGETAIQYLVDTEIDGNPEESDGGTVCYERFSEATWSGKYCIKNPFDWIFDHASRDAGEWIREHYNGNVHTHQPGISQFMQDYQSVQRLSGFSSRLLYARLIFPLHYYETIEEYYLNPSESRSIVLEEKLQFYAESSGYYEEFLSGFYELAHIPARHYKLPELGWL